MKDKSKLSIEYFGASDIGMVRVENQDSFGKFPPENLDIYLGRGQLFIVADGIGGHAGGKEASSLAVDTIRETFFGSASDNVSVMLRHAIEAANKTIRQKAKTSEKFGRMGTTSTVLVLKEDKAVIGQVGDSKVYKIENGTIEQLTMEHTQVNEMLKEGILSEEEAKNYPSKSVLSRALGMEDNVKVDITDNISLNAGQIFVLCTDGLSGVTREEILSIAMQNSPQESCTKLINLANERGGKDNVTVQIIRIKPEQNVPQSPSFKDETKTVGRKKSKWLFVIPVLLILAAAGFLFGNSFLELFTKEEKKEPEVNDLPVNNNNLFKDGHEDDLLSRADQLLKNGNYESALLVFNDVLEKEPMNVSALEGVNKIAAVYQTEADKMKKRKKYKDALELYGKVMKIQPENNMVKNSILFCQDRIRSEHQNDNIINNESRYSVFGVNQSDWSFINIDKSQYKADDNSIRFYSTSFEKKSLIKFELSDVEFSADIKMSASQTGKGAGIIFGYKKPFTENNEHYYLLKYNGSEYNLYTIRNNSAEQLMQSELPAVSSDERNLGVKCSGSLISIYDGMNLIYSWKSDEIISGKVGFYSDRNVLAEFRNILINGNKTGNKVQE